nr:MAG TPA: BRO family protein [Caudoviricetes sp.]
MNEVLTVIQETEILGKKIKVYDNIETPLFLASDVADWIEHSQASKMVKSVDDDEKLRGTLFLSGQNRDA